jgi:hypothetical protein
MSEQPPSPAHPSTGNDVLDEALTRLSRTGPEFASGLSNHGPMACDALVHLGRADAVSSWLDTYLPHLEEAPAPGRALAPDEWAGALGTARRYPDWAALFEQELSARPWAEVVTAWVPRLAPGSVAAGTHGLIRTAHATRALAEADTPERRLELAAGLAYWASKYRSLGAKPVPRGTLAVGQALAGTPVLAVGERSQGFIGDGAAQASRLEGFADAVDALGPPPSIGGALSELTSAMAGWYLANREHHPIAFVHGVTAPAALRLLLPYLPAQAAGTAFAYVWQVCAAIRSAFAVEHPPIDAGTEPPSAEELAAKALERGGAHAIKLTEACLREDAVQADAVYLLAATDASRRLAV